MIEIYPSRGQPDFTYPFRRVGPVDLGAGAPPPAEDDGGEKRDTDITRPNGREK